MPDTSNVKPFLSLGRKISRLMPGFAIQVVFDTEDDAAATYNDTLSPALEAAGLSPHVAVNRSKNRLDIAIELDAPVPFDVWQRHAAELSDLLTTHAPALAADIVSLVDPGCVAPTLDVCTLNAAEADVSDRIEGRLYSISEIEILCSPVAAPALSDMTAQSLPPLPPLPPQDPALDEAFMRRIDADIVCIGIGNGKGKPTRAVFVNAAGVYEAARDRSQRDEVWVDYADFDPLATDPHATDRENEYAGGRHHNAANVRTLDRIRSDIDIHETGFNKKGDPAHATQAAGYAAGGAFYRGLLGLEPTVINSGGGVQVHIELDQRHDPRNVDALATRILALATGFDIRLSVDDTKWDGVLGYMRAPGSWNMKLADKPRPVYVLELGRKHSIEEVEEAVSRAEGVLGLDARQTPGASKPSPQARIDAAKVRVVSSDTPSVPPHIAAARAQRAAGASVLPTGRLGGDLDAHKARQDIERAVAALDVIAQRDAWDILVPGRGGHVLRRDVAMALNRAARHDKFTAPPAGSDDACEDTEEMRLAKAAYHRVFDPETAHEGVNDGIWQRCNRAVNDHLRQVAAFNERGDRDGAADLMARAKTAGSLVAAARKALERDGVPTEAWPVLLRPPVAAVLGESGPEVRLSPEQAQELDVPSIEETLDVVCLEDVGEPGISPGAPADLVDDSFEAGTLAAIPDAANPQGPAQHQVMTRRDAARRALSTMRRRLIPIVDISGKPGAFDAVRGQRLNRDLMGIMAQGWGSAAALPIFLSNDYVIWRAGTCKALGLPYLAIDGNHVNEFRGFDVDLNKTPYTPTPQLEQAVDVLIEFIREVICDDDAASFEYVMRWVAWKFQNRHLLPKVALVLRSDREGTGKTTFANLMARLLAPTARRVSQPGQLAGRFNDVLRGAGLVIAEEAFFAGDPTMRGPLYDLITNERIATEAKNLPIEQTRNHCGVIMLTNARWAVPAKEKSRRFAVLSVSEKYAYGEPGAPAYWRKVAPLVRNANVILAFAARMQAIKIARPPWEGIPETEALMGQKLTGLEPQNRQIYDMLQTGVLGNHQTKTVVNGGRAWATSGVVLDTKSVDELVSAINDYLRGRNKHHADIGRRSVVEQLKKTIGAKSIKDKRTSSMTLHIPKLDDARDAFGKFMGGPIGWEEDATSEADVVPTLDTPRLPERKQAKAVATGDTR
jgi:hypothetical protein